MSVVCPHCGIERETLETPCLVCGFKPEPQAKESQSEASQTEGCPKDTASKHSTSKSANSIRTVKRVSLWVTVYGCLMLVYWLFDTLTFFSLLDTNPGEGFIVWGYSCIRGAIGLSIIVLASTIRKSPHRAVKLLGVVFGLLCFRFFLLTCYDNTFYSFHIMDMLTNSSHTAPRHGAFGGTTLMFVLIYVWYKRRELKQFPVTIPVHPEQRQQTVETGGKPSPIKNIKGWIASNRTPCAVMAVAVIVVASMVFAFKPRDHFYLVTNTNGCTYRIDKTTGKTWLITRSKMVEVEQVEKQTTQKFVSKDPVQKNVSSEDAVRKEFDSLIAEIEEERLKLKNILLNKIGYVKNRVKEDKPDEYGNTLDDYQRYIQKDDFNTLDEKNLADLSKAIDEKFSKAVNMATGR